MASSYLNDFVDKRIGFVRTNTLVRAAVGTFLIMYASYIVPNLDVQAAKYTSNTWVRLLMFSLVAFTSRHDVGLALLLAAAFMFTTDHLFHRGINAARVATGSDPLIRAAMHPFGDNKVRPVLEFADTRPRNDHLSSIPDNSVVEGEGDGLQPYVPEETEELAEF